MYCTYCNRSLFGFPLVCHGFRLLLLYHHQILLFCHRIGMMIVYVICRLQFCLLPVYRSCYILQIQQSDLVLLLVHQVLLLVSLCTGLELLQVFVPARLTALFPIHQTSCIDLYFVCLSMSLSNCLFLLFHIVHLSYSQHLDICFVPYLCCLLWKMP